MQKLERIEQIQTMLTEALKTGEIDNHTRDIAIELAGMARQTITYPFIALQNVCKAAELLYSQFDAQYQFTCQANKRMDDYAANCQYQRLAAMKDLIDSRVFRDAQILIDEIKENI